MNFVTMLIFLNSGAFVSISGSIQVSSAGDSLTMLHFANQSDVWPMNVVETKQDVRAWILRLCINTLSRLAVSHKGYNVLTAL